MGTRIQRRHRLSIESTPRLMATPVCPGHLWGMETEAAFGPWVSALPGIRGRLGFEVNGRVVAVLQLEDERIDLLHDEASVNARVVWKDDGDIEKFLRGELNVVVASLQGRLALDGDVVFAIKVMHGMRAVPPLATDPNQGG
jgi:hypothetical protein